MDIPTNTSVQVSGAIDLGSITLADPGVNSTVISVAKANGTTESLDVAALLEISILDNLASNSTTSTKATKGTKNTKNTGDDPTADATPVTWVVGSRNQTTSTESETEGLAFVDGIGSGLADGEASTNATAGGSGSFAHAGVLALVDNPEEIGRAHV